MSKVSIVRCFDYERENIFNCLKRSVDLIGGIEKFVAPGQKVLIKPNMLRVARIEDAVTTNPEFIRACVRLVKQRTKNIFIGDSPGGLVKSEKVYEQNGISEVARQEGVKLVVFDHVNKHDGIPFARIKDEVDVIISLPKLKTHNITLITAAVKNVFGLIPGLYKVHCHKHAPNFKVFARQLAKIYGLSKPHLNITDGIIAMDGEGPSSGEPYSLGLIFASEDAVAVDAVFSKVIGLDPDAVISTKETARLGLGEADLKKIEIFGESIESVAVDDFRLPKMFFLFRLPNFLTVILLRFIPLVIGFDKKKCSGCLMCKNICPQKAIVDVKGRIKIKISRCILCLCCNEICPQNAIYLRLLRGRKKYEK
ncbi:MAG: DUF362 domain-containing protein [Candidatus Omnitrophica bacterium]|nr:DUF362 domain-containing protein [Candidatus Omnitrophota bacterium]